MPELEQDPALARWPEVVIILFQNKYNNTPNASGIRSLEPWRVQ